MAFREAVSFMNYVVNFEKIVFPKLDIIHRICHKCAAIGLSLAKSQSGANRTTGSQEEFVAGPLQNRSQHTEKRDLSVSLSDIMSLVTHGCLFKGDIPCRWRFFSKSRSDYDIMKRRGEILYPDSYFKAGENFS